jgi:putative peptide zinc metalloprotease protein
MAEGQTKVRTNLDIRSETPEKSSAVVVKDPLTGRFYRFTAVQAAVLRSMDGRTPPAGIAAAVSAEYDAPVTEAQVNDFSVKLRNLLLLDEEYCWRRLEALRKPRHRFLKNILSIKIKAFNPDCLLARMEHRLAFCFTPAFQVLAFLTAASAAVIAVVNWEVLFVSLGTLFTLNSVPLVVAVIFAVMTMHEFAHGLTLKHFGGKTEEMGFLLLYFIPAFYCNISDAWMLKKRERVLVTLAGGYAQLLIWAVCTIAWRMLAPETFGARVCLVAIGFTGVQTLFNFNPLIRLDGYYLLSDLLEIPNLRAKSFGYLRRKLAGWLLGGPGIAASPGERRVYVLFGTASFLFSAALLWVMFERVGGWMLTEYKTWGVILISGLILMAAPLPGRPQPAPAPADPQAKWKTRRRKGIRLLIVAAVLVAIGLIPWELKVSGDFTINAEKRAAVSGRVDGTLRSILVDEGSRIARGDVLAELVNLDLSNDYEDTRGELESKKASLELLRAGARPEEIDRARKQVDTRKAELSTLLKVEQERKVLLETVAKKRAELEQAHANWARSQRLLADGLIARNEAERDRTAFEVQQKELSESEGQLKVLDERTDRAWQVKRKEVSQAESELQILLAGSRKEAIRAMEAEVGKLETKVWILSQQLEYLKIRTPIDGVVATPYLRNKVGQYLAKGTPLCDIVSLGVVKIDMPVPEKEIADVRPGYHITMKVRGYPQRSFDAQVKSISPIAVDAGPERMVLVQGELENRDGVLKAGMTGVGKILCGQRRVWEIATRRLVRWLRTEFWEYLP